METTLRQLHKLSSDLNEQLHTSGLDQIGAYMAQRETVFQRLETLQSDPATMNKLKPLVDSILQMDSVIVGRMMELQAEAQTELSRLAAGRTAKSKYEVGTAEQESYFFDAKK